MLLITKQPLTIVNITQINITMENLERATVIQTAGKVDFDPMDELIKVRQQNVLLARELEETNAAYKRVVEEKNEAVSKLEVLGNGVSDVFDELIETELQCSICHEVVVNDIDRKSRCLFSCNGNDNEYV
ncbi:hypothetical protein J437_LFUL006096 [Ladona fulva]|uniref:Uncharacterized protein n=1 Tax=Ladona fulva TaxID=123851 RepID=A0A8K0JYA0_LADFU|nr:hypothetical protein J437_LFUL006096 [Ladona fulva]